MYILWLLLLNFIKMKTVLNVKIDPKLKKASQQVAKEAGIPLSLVVNSALHRFVSERSITIQAPFVPNAKTAKILKTALNDIKAGRNISPMFKTGREMDKYLDNL